MKKFWLSFLSLIAILFIWTTFANPIAPETHFVCSMFENVEIDNYRVVVQNGSSFYEPTKYSCSQCWQYPINEDGDTSRSRYFGSFNGPSQQVFLLDKSVSIEDIRENNIESSAISIWSITSTYCDRWANKKRVYKITNIWNSYTMLDRTEHYNIIQEIKDRIKDFPLYWSLAVIIETLVLFFIAKLFRKEDYISNKKLLCWWIIPTTITLPLLWFVLPLLLWNWTLYVIIWELLVAVLESIMIKYWLGISRKKAIIASIVCNIFSFIVLPNNLRATSFIRRFLFWLFWIVLIEGIILFIVGKLSKEWISNKKLVLWWFITSIVDFLILMVWLRFFDEVFYMDSVLPVIVTIIIVKLLVDMLIIKLLRKLLWKKCIMASIFFNLCIVAIILAFDYFFG